MTLFTEDGFFSIDGQRFHTYVCWDDSIAGERTGVLVAPTFAGLSEFEKGKARDLAAAGYVGFAIDPYGEGKSGTTIAEFTALMHELTDDRAVLSSRMGHALAALKAHPMVVADRTAAIGFCFGGKCVLDLARSGAETNAVVSLHGIYDPPGAVETREARSLASILVLHGHDDPMSSPESVNALAQELGQICDDWQFVAFGHTMHSFTNPAAAAPERGVMYHRRSAARAWRMLLDFIAEQVDGVAA